MLRVWSTEIRQDPIQWADRSVTLVSRVWFARVVTPWFGLGISYHQPTRVETTHADPESHPIRDHLMLVKLSTALVLITMALTRRNRK